MKKYTTIKDKVDELISEIRQECTNSTLRRIEDWLTQTLEAERQKREEMVEDAYARGYKQGQFDGTMNTLHPTHAMHEPNLQARHTGDNPTPLTNDKE